jgi:hypothetical protein
MTKKAIITVSLVPEAEKESNKAIRKEILKDSQILWCNEIEKIEIEKSEDCIIRGLQKHGLPKNVAKTVARLYLG